MTNKISLLLIIILSIITYYNTLNSNFVYDDNTIIVNNEKNLSLSYIPDYFTNSGNYKYSFGNFYRPLIMTSFALDKSLYGLSPKGFHFTNLVLNTIVGIILFYVLLLIFSKYKYGGIASLISALIYIAHPVHTEAVAFISSRTDVMCTLFYFLSFYFFLKYRGYTIPQIDLPKSKNKNKSKQQEKNLSKVNSGYSYLIYIVLFYILGLFSKEMAITLPLVLFLFDIMILRNKIKNIYKEYILLLFFTIIYLLIRHFAIKDIPLKPQLSWFYGKDLLTVFSTVVKAIPVYIKLLFYPLDLNYTYNGEISYSNSPFEFYSLLSIILVIGLIISGIYLINKKNFYSYSIFIFFILLSPVINIFSDINVLAERYLYLVSFSLIFAITYYLSTNANERNIKNYVIISASVILIFTFFTIQRNYVWQSEEALWKSGENNKSPAAMINIAGLYTRTGQLEKAEQLYRESLAINDGMINAHINLGILYILKNKLDTAEVHLQKALRLDEENPNANYIYAKLKLAANSPNEAKNILQNMKDKGLIYRDSKRLLDSLSR